MKKIAFCLVIVLPSLVLSREYFTAAVFEHRLRAKITDESNPQEVKAANLKYFSKAVEIAAKHKTDIIVFNEYGTSSYPGNRNNMFKYAENIPDPKKYKINPCLDNSRDTFTLSFMSCLAITYNMYIVINLLDIQECEPHCDNPVIGDCDFECPEDGFLTYNTNIVFDREGFVIARYHKRHPYFEYVNTPEPTQYVTFDTEFGRFGLIVCFDSIFKQSYHLVKDYSVNTLIFPTYWFDDIASLNAVEFQQSWALANKVNFLAANAQNASTATVGSGIYSKDSGALVYTYDNDGESKLLIANVKIKDDAKIPQSTSIIVIRENEVFTKPTETGDNFPLHCYQPFVGPAVDPVHDYRCAKSQTENFSLRKLRNPTGTIEACSDGFCCTLTYFIQDFRDTWYLAAFKGTNNVKKFYHWREETCLLVRCDPYEHNECVMLPSVSKTVFRNLELKAKFTSQQVYPTVTKNKYRLAPINEWNYTKNGTETILRFKSESDIPLLKVALFGRNYDTDPRFTPWYNYKRPKEFYI